MTKFAWYAEFGVKHFWIMDPYKKTFDAFLLEKDEYRQVARLLKNATFRPAAFRNIEIKLKDVWPASE